MRAPLVQATTEPRQRPLCRVALLSPRLAGRYCVALVDGVGGIRLDARTTSYGLFRCRVFTSRVMVSHMMPIPLVCTCTGLLAATPPPYRPAQRRFPRSSETLYHRSRHCLLPLDRFIPVSYPPPPLSSFPCHNSLAPPRLFLSAPNPFVPRSFSCPTDVRGALHISHSCDSLASFANLPAPPQPSWPSPWIR